MSLTSQKISFFFAAIAYFGLASLSPSAQAGSRSVNFNATGYNSIPDANIIPASQMYPDCQVIIVNSSTASQDITVTLSVSLNGTPQAATYKALYNGTSTASASAYSGATWVLGPQGTGTDSVVVSWNTTLTGGVAYGTQRLDCSGSIQVVDHTAGTPGYITASGFMTTITESAPGGEVGSTSGASTRTYTGAPSQTPLSIGEGRPF